MPERSARQARAVPTALRSLAIVTSAIALVAVAALAGVALRETRQAASSPSPSATAPAGAASPSPSASQAAPSPTTAPSPTPTPETRSGVLDERFGIVVSSRDKPAEQFVAWDVRRETSTETVGTFGWRGFAVSPDGRSVAYWTPSSPQSLHVVRAAGGAPTPALLTLPSEMLGGAIAWSSDGGGLVVGVQKRVVWQAPPATPTPPQAELWTVDVASRASDRVASRTDGWEWRPVAWDRARQVIGTVVTGEGGFLISYDVVAIDQRPARVTTTKLGGELAARSVWASSDARYVAAQRIAPTPETYWWPLTAPEERKTIATAAVAWRPGTSELWYVDRNGDAIALDVATGARRTAIRGITEPLDALAFRPDGSALIVVGRSGDPNAPDRGPQTQAVYIDVASGQRATVPVGAYVAGYVRLQ